MAFLAEQARKLCITVLPAALDFQGQRELKLESHWLLVILLFR
jgi:hypothetical protein